MFRILSSIYDNFDTSISSGKIITCIFNEKTLAFVDFMFDSKVQMGVCLDNKGHKSDDHLVLSTHHPLSTYYPL